MIFGQDTKTIVLEPLSYTNGATATCTVDTLAASYVVGTILVGRSNNATNVPTVLKLQEADVTNSSSFADITGGSATSAYTTASTTGCDVIRFEVDTRPRKRYLRLQVSPVTTQLVAADFSLSRLEQSAYNTTTKNIQVLVSL
jgi:hypothetical protein